jgi:hypothetical protein
MPLREIVREHEFEEQLERLLVDMEEADDFTMGAEFVLAHDPLSGTPVNSDASIWMLPMCPVSGRQVSLYYTFDERTVTFLAILPDD